VGGRRPEPVGVEEAEVLCGVEGGRHASGRRQCGEEGVARYPIAGDGVLLLIR
jgi:hypothetical protein